MLPSAIVKRAPVLTVELERLEAKFALAGEGRSHRAVGVIECQLFSAGNAEAEPSTDEQDTDHLGQPVSRCATTWRP